MALRGIGTGRRRRHLNADVNIINLVDVVLVLLIIFMLTAPMLQGGLDVELPKAALRPLDAEEGLTISVTRDGQVAMDGAAVSMAEFKANLATVLRLKGTDRVYVRGDTRVNYGVIMDVMGAIQSAGITNIGLVAEPEDRR
ncbi:MAG: biopolymer transporter ExbD [Gemmatimonadetes bacterium]|nr:biopolymer transporter ExbD [Gemmatimonadota bacterium]MCB9505654.1 biopolymer transporter ExbD [Gemmatimonadales bacterium]MCA9762662.1 biopolymer transporter ExbD [Gemmatimonadota bacterium]MCA9767662.1 biopolymer transporter ExbD [Gemmatimonadota bacterium]MCB9517330.1 biopolymer transporter ExbD [Gemmatimonadales bacterium]